MEMQREYNFTVVTLEAGKRGNRGDSYYRYLIKDNSLIAHPDTVIKKFCVGVVRQAYDPDKMPNSFAAEITKFTTTTANVWAYEVKELSTD